MTPGGRERITNDVLSSTFGKWRNKFTSREPDDGWYDLAKVIDKDASDSVKTFMQVVVHGDGDSSRHPGPRS